MSTFDAIFTARYDLGVPRGGSLANSTPSQATKFIFLGLVFNLCAGLLVAIGIRIGIFVEKNQISLGSTSTPVQTVSQSSVNAPPAKEEEVEKDPEVKLSAEELTELTDQLIASERKEIVKDVTLPSKPVAALPSDQENEQPTAVGEITLVPAKINPPVQAVKKPKPRLGAKSFYTLQVASFPSKAMAQAQTNGFTKRGIYAFVGSREINGQIWYRTNVGKFYNERDAEKYKAKIKEIAGIEDPILQWFK